LGFIEWEIEWAEELEDEIYLVLDGKDNLIHEE